MKKKNSNQYIEACRALINKSNSLQELQKLVMEKFKVKGKRDKGWESIRKAARREWDKASKKKPKNKGGTKKTLQNKEEEDSEEEDEELEEEEEEESAGEESQEEEEEKKDKGKIQFFTS